MGPLDSLRDGEGEREFLHYSGARSLGDKTFDENGT